MGFADDVRKFQAKALEAANDATCKITSELFVSVVELSPTETMGAKYSVGQLKNQWYPTSGGAHSSEVGSSADNSGSASLSRIKAIIAEDLFYGRDNTISLTNNTEQAIYAERLGWKAGEGTNGWIWTGNVMPYAMVAHSVNKIKGKNP